MFEAAETGHSVSTELYRQTEPEIHNLILSLQRRLRSSGKSLIIIVSGVEGSGKGEVVDKLNRWFDTRGVQTHAYWDESDEERERPWFWRFWRTLPEQGRVSVMFGSWYSKPIIERAFGRISEAELDRELQKIEALERTLVLNGAIIVKLWLHLSREEQQRRLQEGSNARRIKKSPLLEEFSKKYETFIGVSERALRLTDSGFAPWHIIEATDLRYLYLNVGQAVIDRLGAALGDDEGSLSQDSETEPALSSRVKEVSQSLARLSGKETLLDVLNLDQSLSREEYEIRMDEARQSLHRLAWAMYENHRNVVMVFEGWDAAGKGSAIRRVSAAIDARLYRVIPVSAPTDEEKAHHYLWRFWRQIPRAGHMTIYDRSWYGRVLVERVEGLASTEQWHRAYQEINEFEEQLSDHGIVILKFWIHISKDEQLARFHARQQDERKQHKMSEEDWRNREKWDQYKAAVNDMVAHTSTARAPWTIVPGNDKKYARVMILETINRALADCLESKGCRVNDEQTEY